LLEYYELHYQHEIKSADISPSGWGTPDEQYPVFYKKTRAVIDKIGASITPFSMAGETLKQKFSSSYLSGQIDIMLKMQTENPTEAIGKAKELIESCCKTIFEESGEQLNKDWSVSQLAKATMKLLAISADDINGGSTENSTVRAILGNLSGIAGNMAELRNAYGSGHGKSASYQGLTVRHAKLAVGSSITLVNYLWDTYEWRRGSGRLKQNQ